MGTGMSKVLEDADNTPIFKVAFTASSRAAKCSWGSPLVVKGLYLGNIRDSEDRDNLLKNGVTHILSVHNSAKPVLEGMTYLCISASDSSSQNLRQEIPQKVSQIMSFLADEDHSFHLLLVEEGSVAPGWLQHFKECIKFIHECRLGGGGCLVHCLAGVSRSTTILVAYLMTVTELSWETCLAATRAVRSYVSPNFGFQQQLQEYEVTLLQEYRAWIHHDYGRNPFKDQEELQCLVAAQEQRQKEQQLGSRDCSWHHSPAPTYPLPYHTGGTTRSRWMNR